MGTIAELIGFYGEEMKWQEVLVRSEKIGINRLTIFSLRLISYIHGSENMSLIVQLKVWGYDIIKNFIARGFFKVCRVQDIP